MQAGEKDQIKGSDRTICTVCAWRKDCRKKYSFQDSGPVKCPDYTRDASIPTESESKE